MNRQGLLATLHCAKRDLALDDETYRAILVRVGGRASARELDERSLVRVVEEMRSRGWRPKKGRTNGVSTKPHVRKVWALWREICALDGAREPTRASLRAFVERVTKVTDPEWLTVKQSRDVIEQLKTWKARLEAARKESAACPSK